MEYDWLLKIKLVKLGNSAGIKNLRKPKFRLSRKIFIFTDFYIPSSYKTEINSPEVLGHFNLIDNFIDKADKIISWL